VEVEYKAPARYQDKVKVYANIEKMGRSSIVWHQKITRDEQLLIDARITWVCVNRDFKPRSAPDEIKSLMSKL